MLSRIDTLDKDIDLIIRQDLSSAAQSQVLADFARETLVEAEQTNEAALGNIPPHVTFVDGRVGASEDSVRPDGVIVYEFELAQELLDWIAEQLVLHSPVKTGRYKNSHQLFVDGTEVNTQSVSLAPGKEAVFLNTTAYARKIEGDDNRAPESPQAPDGVYEVVAAMAQRRFGNIAKISFAWRAPIGGSGTHLEDWASTTKQTRPGRKVAVDHWNRRQPAIIVVLR